MFDLISKNGMHEYLWVRSLWMCAYKKQEITGPDEWLDL